MFPGTSVGKQSNISVLGGVKTMLAHLLAIAVALASFGLYFSAFFFPELHRKSDFYWSGLGLFYALVLWVCAGRITGGVLLGQIASATLLLWFGTQTLILRRLLASPEEKTNISQTIASPFQFLSPKTLWQQITGRKQEATTQSSPSQTIATSNTESQPQQEQEKSTTEASSSETSSTLTNESQQPEEVETTDSPNQPTDERPSNPKGSASSSQSQ